MIKYIITKEGTSKDQEGREMTKRKLRNGNGGIIK
jgi:hypothetical protein